MEIHCSSKQRGVVAVLVTVALPVLLLIMGLALDFGHVFVNKTRLQNALDATALSAAIYVNRDVAKDTTEATSKAKDTFTKFIAASGNTELSRLNEGSLVFDYSKTLKPWGTFNPATDAFAFVRVKSTNMLNVTPLLIRILNQFSNPMPVPAIATAGPVGQNCSLVPFVMCAMMTPSLDRNCNDDTIKLDNSGNSVLGTDGIKDCYGYNIGQIRSLTQAPVCEGNANKDPVECATSLESGNFNLLNLDGSQGGKDIRDILQGTTNTCLQGNTLDTKPGWTWGNVSKGIDDRFDSDTNRTIYTVPPSAYTQYQTSGLGNYRRVMSAPIGDCTGLQKGSSTISKVGAGCVFLTNHSINAGKNKYVMTEFIGSCQQNGAWNPDNAVLNGPYKIVLFKSPGSGDS